MARVGSVIFQVSKIIKAHNGIGISKLKRRNESGKIAESGHKVSDLFHSYKSLDNARNDLINLGNFAKKEFDVKNMGDIDIEIISSWLESKNIIYRTASNYLSEINKIVEHLSVSKEEVKELRRVLKEKFETKGKLAQQTRAYKNLDKIVLPQRSQPAFELQRNYGLRVKEAIHINIPRQLISGNILKYNQKGGKESEVEISKKLKEDIIKNSKNNIYSVNYKTYTRDLKQAIEQTGQKYNGTHGIRHSFAQKKLEEGATKKEVSAAMGHVREEITDVYLR